MIRWLKRFLGIGERKIPPIPEGFERVSRTALLNAIPTLHPNVERVREKRLGCYLRWDLSEAQHKRPRFNFFPKFFFNLTRNRQHKLVLDDMGRRTVELMDGCNTVADIAYQLSRQVGCDKKAMENAVIAFISQLARRNAAQLAMRPVK